MDRRIQFGSIPLAAALLLLASLCPDALFAQSHPDRPPQKPSAPAAPKTGSAPRPNAGAPNAGSANGNRPPATRPAENPALHRDENRPPSANGNASRQNNLNNRPYENGPRLTPRQQVGVGAARPFVDKMRDLSPRDRDRVLQSSRAFQNLAPEQQNRIRNQFNQWDRMNPQQRADLREKEQVWRTLTPDQKQHIKNDVLPQWKQMPWGRQQVIQQKLGLLQNMPEGARNRRLADPEFTRGLSDNERSMLHDLSHLHVGGAPDPPSNEP